MEGAPDCLLALSGSAVVAMPQPGALAFSAPVRSSAAQSVAVANPTAAPWRLRPIAQPGVTWSAPDVLVRTFFQDKILPSRPSGQPLTLVS